MANYLYNGVTLPEMPERDEATYPYAYLMHEDGTNLYSLFFSMQQISVNKAGGHLFLSDASSYNYTPKSGGWINVISGGLGQKVIWSNTDVYYYDSVEEVGGTLYLAASEPVPVEEEANCTYYLYNGFPAPELPEWNKVLYPYAFLDYSYHFGRPTVSLYYSSSPFTYDTSAKKVMAGGVFYSTDYGWYQVPLEKSMLFRHEWGEVEEDTYGGEVTEDMVLWTNYDMKTTAGALYKSASEPVLWEHVETDPMGINRHTAYTLGKIMGRKIASRNRMAALMGEEDQSPDAPVEPEAPEEPPKVDTNGDGYALYNGVKLPNIDAVWTEELKQTHPYAVAQVFQGGGTTICSLSFLDCNLYAATHKDGDLHLYASGSGTLREYAYDSTGEYASSENWEDYGLREVTADENFGMASLYAWSSHDIINTTDNSVYLAASAPIPLDGMNVIEWDGVTEGLESDVSGTFLRIADYQDAENALLTCRAGTMYVPMLDAFETVEKTETEPSGWILYQGDSALIAFSEEYATMSPGIWIVANYFVGVESFILAYTPATTEPEEPEEPVPEDKYVPHIIESSGNGYALYNGVKLPNIDTVWTDKETYTGAIIFNHLSEGITFYSLLLLPDKESFCYENQILVATPYRYYYIEPTEMSEWELETDEGETTEWEIRDTDYPLWSNHDILNVDNSVYLSASEPVPVYE